MQVLVDPSGHKVEVTCPGCGQKVVFSLTHAGNSIFCRSCGIKIEIISEELEALKKQVESAEGVPQ
jgi:ribosomal protein S27E